MKVAFDTFKGEIPKLADHRLPHTYAQLAQNCKLIKGDLRSFRALSREEAFALTAIQSIFRYEENSNQNWVESGDVRHYVKSTVSGDQYERVYYADGTQPCFFSNDNISGGGFDFTADFYKLGIPASTTKPTVGSSGGGSTYKAYVYSYVNSYGDEGPPSPIDSISDYDTGNVTIEDIVAAPADRAIDKIYLYRTNASAFGTAEFQFVLEATWFSATEDYEVGDFVIYATDLYKCTTTHSSAAWDAGHFTAGDDVADADLLSVYPKTNYDPPPATLKGLIVLANGSLAGFVDNQIYFSEPYYPHAWPTDYIIPVDAEIVGISNEKNTITVVTKGEPHTVYGTHPSTMQKTKASHRYPGLNIRSVISGNGGVFFVTREGLIFNGPNGFINITEQLMETDDWSDYNPNTLAIYFFEKKLFVFDSVGETGFFIDFSSETIGKISLGIYAHAANVTDDGYFFLACDDLDAVNENNPPANMPLALKKWEGDTDNYLLFTWTSEEILLDYNTNFSIAKIIIDQDFYDSIQATLDLVTLNAATFAAGLTGALGVDGPIGGGHELAGDEMISLGDIFISQDVSFKLYADGELKKTKIIQDINNLFRLPAGYASNRFHIQVSGYIPIKKVVLATSPDEL